MWKPIKKILERISGKSVPEKWQQDIVAETAAFTMTSSENIIALTKAILHIANNKIEGAIVECGVWKGGSMMAAAKTLLHVGDKDRQLFLYDTFGNFSDPQEEDISYKGESGAAVLKELSSNGQPWLAPTEEEVRTNLALTRYPIENFYFIKGQVEQTIPANIPSKIALLRLDTDWYASTKHELTWLYPRLSPGAVLIIDDYGYWKGCKKAVDEFFEKEKIKPELIPIDFSARMIYKV